MQRPGDGGLRAKQRFGGTRSAPRGYDLQEHPQVRKAQEFIRENVQFFHSVGYIKYDDCNNASPGLDVGRAAAR
jgi:hypothetical protein